LVIPGRVREHANPESRNQHRAGVWVPGPALTRRPGMTSKAVDFNVTSSVDPAEWTAP
jgi:hypothetical protein